MRARAVAWFALLFAAGGCGRTTGPVGAITGEYFPVQDGARWTFQRSGGAAHTLTMSGPSARYGVSDAWHVDDSLGGAEEFAVRGWIVYAMDREVPVTGLWYEFLHEPPVTGDSWQSPIEFTLSGQPQKYAYDASVPDRSEVSTPAGAFSDCPTLSIRFGYDPPLPGFSAAVRRTVRLARGIGWVSVETTRYDSAGAVTSFDSDALASYSFPR